MTDFKNIKYFKGLDGLRFFAAFLVLMHHSETIRKKNGLFNLEWLGLFRNGGNAVTFFFVLSGFLITYLLLKEKRVTGTVSIKQFYLRRMLRIWPLYFLLIAIGCFILPYGLKFLGVAYEMPYQFGNTWYYFLFFLPGLVTFYYGHHFLEPLWSIGVEEVFYLFWAPVFKWFKKILPVVLCTVIILKLIFVIYVTYFDKGLNPLMSYLLGIFQFEAMAIGGLGAWAVYNFKKDDFSRLGIYKKIVQLVIYILLFIFLIFHSNIDHIIWNSVFKNPVYSPLIIEFLFLYLVIGVSMAGNSIINPAGRILNFLGEISYGIYMYQMLVIFIIMHFFKGILTEMHPAAATALYYGLALILIVSIAAISKYTFENYFLKLKKRFDKAAGKV